MVAGREDGGPRVGHVGLVVEEWTRTCVIREFVYGRKVDEKEVGVAEEVK